MLAFLFVGAACSGGTATDTTSTTATSTSAAAASTSASASTSAPTSVAPSTTTITAGAPLRWTALGDSYSAGIGAGTSIQNITPDCSRDPASNYATLGAKLLQGAGRTVALDLRACDGATIKEIAAQAAGVTNADAISLTLGGNDFGFSRVLTQCLIRGCKSYDQPDDRFVSFAREDGRTDWQVLEQRITDALAGLRPMLAPNGRVYVLTYPVPFPEQPDETCLRETAPLSAASRLLANAAIDRLDRAILTSIAAANAKAGTVFATVVEWRTGLDKPLRTTTDAAGVVRQVRDNPNGICSPEPMINGIASTELSDSFHPTDRGLAFAAAAVSGAIATQRGAN